MSGKTARPSGRWWLRRVGVGVGLAVVIVLLMSYLVGAFRPRLDPGRQAGTAERGVAGSVNLVAVRTLSVPDQETAVGAIRPVYETQLASQLLARVVEIDLRAGQAVQAGQVLVRLDDADLRARLQQAQAALASAQASAEQATIELTRVQQLRQQGAATQVEVERHLTAARTSQAQVEQARQQISELQSVLEYATVRAPIDGIVVDKKVNVGDVVVPGQALVNLYDPSRMQLVASVRESLATRLAVGQEIDVLIEAIHERCRGTVSEIVPEAAGASRSFQVKVTGPCHPRVFAGMFGRLLIQLDEQEVLAIPAAAVQRVGQIDMVQVRATQNDRPALARRAVQVGRPLEDGRMVEVLAGLRAGEMVAVPER